MRLLAPLLYLFLVAHASVAFTIQPSCRRTPIAQNQIFATTDKLDDFLADATSPFEDSTDDTINQLRASMKEHAEKPDGAPMVEDLLFRLIDECYKNPMSQPTNEDFYVAMQAWANYKSPESSRRIGLLFLTQEDLLEKGMTEVAPDARTIHIVLRSLSSSRERGADRRAWSILESVSEKYGLDVDAEMYGSVIRSLARSKDRGSAERAEKVLKDAIAEFPPGIDKDGNATGITVDSFNVILTAWAKSGLDDGSKRAEELLVYMDHVHKEHGKNKLTPNVFSFTSLIDAYAQTNEWNGVSQSERILNRLLDQFLEGNEELEPNVASWTIVISAWTRLARKGYKGCAEKADRLLRRMEDLYQSGQTTCAPDAITYITVTNAWAASTKSADSPKHAEEILDEMHERYLDGEDEMKPTIKSVKVVIDAWIARMEDANAMDRAESVLDKYEDVLEEFQQEPIVDETARDVYRSMLFGWTKHKDPHRAEEYLRNMVSLGMKPDCFCFDRIIESLTQLNAPDSLERTYAVFELMDKCANKGDLKPNERVYTSFIRALTKARVKGFAKKALVILKKMEALYQAGNKGIKPTTFTYNAVLNACAESVDDEEPLETFKVAIGAFNELRDSRGQEPDHVTFGNMLRCAVLLPVGNQRDSVISSTFQLCCKRGLVNSYVIRDLQYAASEEQWRTLLSWPEGEVDCEKLPASWRSRQYERKPKNDRQRRPGRPDGRKFTKRR